MSDSIRRKQVWKYAAPLIALSLALTLAACGKRPGDVDPPPGVKKGQFPLVYPNPATDPKPENTTK